ncbi:MULTISPECIES: DUF4394 domain-containing protein [unclassified Leisingera]|uniref:DUF4394 domain-containing protein n=1 Tax=unclassified Leisingera TaxID=2614906 RepID=UPI0010111614|nr:MULTISPECIES: DUF4394 domain-containing protein [unclassified Leisingera]MCF6433425.1 DUF4394 domain-containing protein [Leisingera sp. MMG026]QAX32404.1 DUF4394 domain-containing protein [Leisingera sp. NJS204]
MKTQALVTSMIALAASPAFAAGHAAVSGYALADDGATLVVMSNVNAPGDVMTYSLASPLKAIAWRPVTGELLGFSDGMIATIDPMSGDMTDLGAAFMDDAMIGEGKMVAFDFNNKIDAVRAVTSTGDNLVYFPEGFGDNDERAGSVRRFTDLAYADGDSMAGTTPMIFANAYTNAINGETAGATFQYALDAATDTLVSLANNAGTLETIGKITVDGAPVDLAPMGGFDIVSAKEGEDMALAILQMEGAASAGLYEIDLETGAATMKANLGMGGITGFAASLGM